jgi:Uncharacterised nucleotidyltransferase
MLDFRSARRSVAAHALLLEVQTVQIAEAMGRRGIRAVVLKGPAFSRLLYNSLGERAYSDIDLLIDPAAFVLAEQLLASVGFERFELDALARQTDPIVAQAAGAAGAAHAVTWIRRRDNLLVDLHDSLPQVALPAAEAWQVLGRHTQEITLSSGRVETLDTSATAMLVALHAAHHGPAWGQAVTDLERATQRFESQQWSAALALARSLGCEAAFAVGLGLTERGREIAAALALSTEPTPAYRLLWSGAPWSAHIVQALTSEQSIRRRIMLAARVAWPSPNALRRGSALARKGRAGLVAAHLLRCLQLLRKLPQGIRERRRAPE